MTIDRLELEENLVPLNLPGKSHQVQVWMG